MDKCWYCIVEGGAKGPYTKEDLMSKPYFTRESLVWKEGFSEWTPAKDVEGFFEEDGEKGNKPKRPKFDELSDDESVEAEGGVAAMEEKEPPNLIFWLIVLVLILIFYLFQTFSR